MKALSIMQPWAWAICEAGKDVENRTWHTAYRGFFLIHTGLKADLTDWDTVEEICGMRPPEDLPRGGIVGQACLEDSLYGEDGAANSGWYFGPVGFMLREARSLPFQPCKGKLGFFEPDFNSVYAKDKQKPIERTLFNRNQRTHN